jgi:hypothetical protein
MHSGRHRVAISADTFYAIAAADMASPPLATRLAAR